MPKWLLVVFTVIFKAVIVNTSPIIRDEIEKFLNLLERRAKETPNVFDDMAVDLMKTIFRVD